MKRRPGELILFDRPVSRPVKVRADWPVDFSEQFWRVYPRRVAKKAALAALERVRRSGEVAFSRLLAAVERYADSVAGKEIQFVAHPATWLNQGRWEDDPASLGHGHAQRRISSTEGWAERRHAQIEGAERPHGPLLITSNSGTSN
jgi:hypothetical protein